MAVLDASALLAFVYAEEGHEMVTGHLEDGLVSAVNWSEVLQKIEARGGDPDELGEWIIALGLSVVPYGPVDARETAALYAHTSSDGLSLADRSCLALARRSEAVAVTADKAWAKTDVGVTVRLVR